MLFYHNILINATAVSVFLQIGGISFDKNRGKFCQNQNPVGIIHILLAKTNIVMIFYL
jgi:hypothetical protein